MFAIKFCEFNKSDDYKFTYESRTIENPRINEKIAVVLEGTDLPHLF